MLSAGRNIDVHALFTKNNYGKNTIIKFNTYFCAHDYTYIIIWRPRNCKTFRRA